MTRTSWDRIVPKVSRIEYNIIIITKLITSVRFYYIFKNCQLATIILLETLGNGHIVILLRQIPCTYAALYEREE